MTVFLFILINNIVGLIPGTANVTGNYSEPLIKNFFFRLGARYDYEKLDNRVGTFENGATNDPIKSLSSRFARESNKYSISTGIEYKYKNITVRPYFADDCG